MKVWILMHGSVYDDNGDQVAEVFSTKEAALERLDQYTKDVDYMDGFEYYYLIIKEVK